MPTVRSPAPSAALPTAMAVALAVAPPPECAHRDSRPLPASCDVPAAGRPSPPRGTAAVVRHPTILDQPELTNPPILTQPDPTFTHPKQTDPTQPSTIPNKHATKHDPLLALTLTNSQWFLLGLHINIQTILVMHGIERNPGPTETSTITIAHVNINSVTAENKLEELEQFTEINNIKILALTETKLDETIAPSQYTIHNFHPPITKHRTRHGGGVALYVHISLPVQRLTNIEIGNEEWIWAKIKVNQSTIIVNCVYIPPHSSAERLQTFLDLFTEANCMAKTQTPTSVITLGDFNAGNIYLNHNFNRHSGITPFDYKLRQTSDTLDLNQLIDEPTRTTNDVANLRDLIFTSNYNIVQRSGTLSSFANLDHFPIFIEVNVAPMVYENDNPPIFIWEYRKTNTDLLTATLIDTNWEDILSKDIDTATSDFITVLHDAANAAIPKICIRQKNRDKLWITSDLKRNIRKRDRLFKLAKQTESDTNWNRWRYQRNLVTSMNRQLKGEYIKNQVQKLIEQKQTPYKYHKTLKSIIGRPNDRCIPPLLTQHDEVVTNDMEKASIFNNHFVAQSTLDTSSSNIPPVTSPTQAPIFEQFLTSEQEVLQILNSLDTNKSTGPDGLPTQFLKMTALLIARPLSQLFNKSLDLGIYPSQFKIAHVKPKDHPRIFQTTDQ